MGSSRRDSAGEIVEFERDLHSLEFLVDTVEAGDTGSLLMELLPRLTWA